jgi:uncharacterized protein (TIGR00299 family) protein
MKIAYFDCFSGISGDMTIAAFLDAGLPMRELISGLGRLKLKGYSLRKTRVMRGPIAGTKFDCSSPERGHSRSLRQILRLLESSALKPKVKDLSKRIFSNIGDAEAKVHGIRDASGVHLHELGCVDSIVDIVGAAIAVDAMGIDEIRSSPVTMGRTITGTAHGAIPVPAPAALELLKGVPAEITDVAEELVTPTGAGILKTFAKAFGAMPPMEISAVGYGAGARQGSRAPNMLRVVIGRSLPGGGSGSVTVIEANIDDMNPQFFEHLFERLFEEGALDVYVTPVQMKKSRPAFKLSVICDDSKLERLSSVVLRESTTIGVRFHRAGRITLERSSSRVKTPYGEIAVKVSAAPGGARTVSPEYEDCRRAAKRSGSPLRHVYDAAKAAAIKGGL